MDLDKTDMGILKLLQEEGRLNNSEIAKRVFLSPPACWKRLKTLEKGVIKSYRAIIEPKHLGFNFYAFMNITLDLHSEDNMAHFEQEIMKIDNVISCHNISGRYDYMLQLVVKDMEDFHNVSMMKVRAIGNIKEMNTSFSIREIKPFKGFPIK
ncbi:Lrp/AsnC family transcriptional regulator [Proteus terrae]|uniref:Lrp/AsnC family transcriptional regulator n=1 Tax=Proteus terrae subsp. cibarius TaxID=626774 RepID=A0A6G6SRC0_9GAMM|nr:Lrp/AsnC family transcriptional regulator [Proteus terrae]QHP75247.1 Lrp/AsnC family transcriptional regulator [Proteus vulgaris]MBG2914719.1 Lrp/AsnC family transcriptional regulator [Proteus terrae subsp. cibarius]QGW01895.1 Lrp/AsnC family transcriptional regulator [Proteus terrae subsp. cibarius]QIF91089.1 winged helix-turn-helix transcriptional regulator [Proteus terrae subsp. cibarius]QIF96957.1 winged helix-turn-helix transcriptional regulator [Proteus terrae subsp. cibarius]